MMDASFELATAAEVAFQAAHDGEQKATGDHPRIMCLLHTLYNANQLNLSWSCG